MGYSNFGVGIAGAGVLGLLAIVVIIVLVVVLYVKCLGKNAKRDSKLSRFFRFDHLFIEKILQVIYMINVVAITVFAVITPFTAASAAGMFGDFGAAIMGFFGGIVTGLLTFAIGQFVLRLVFEYLLLFVRMANDVRAIRNGAAGENVAPVAEQGPAPSIIPPSLGTMMQSAATRFQQHTEPSVTAAPAAAPAPAAPVAAPAPAASAAPAPDPAAPAAPSTWACECGKADNSGNFCGACGKPRP